MKLQSKKAHENTVVGETAGMSQDIQTSCNQEHVSSDLQNQEKVKESMTQCEKDQENVKTEKAKKWVYACGREGFSIKNIKKDFYLLQ